MRTTRQLTQSRAAPVVAAGFVRACWLRKVEGKPWCELCLHYLLSRGANVALAVTFFLMSLGLAALGVRWQSHGSEDPSWTIWAVVAVGGAIGALYIGRRDRR